MAAHFGAVRAPSVAKDHVFGALDGQTADQALAAGIPPRMIWAQVCLDFDVPETLRYGLPG